MTGNAGYQKADNKRQKQKAETAGRYSRQIQQVETAI